MKYTTILTSKGTTTIPAKIRKELGITPGMKISFTKNTYTGEYVLQRVQTIAEIRALNRAALQKTGTKDKEYTSGEGFTQFVIQKHKRQK